MSLLIYLSGSTLMFPLELGDDLAERYLQVRNSTLEKYLVAGALVATLQLQLVCAHPWLRNDDEHDYEGDDASIMLLKAYQLITPKMGGQYHSFKRPFSMDERS